MTEQVDSSNTSALWRYGLFAVDSELLTSSKIRLTGEQLGLGGQQVSLDEFDRILVVGAGKASAGMARGLLKSLKPLIDSSKTSPMEISGWINVPDDCLEEMGPIRLHAGRPASRNEPTEEGMQGAREMMKIVRSAGPRDLVICLVSGGGSALAPLPVEGVSLRAKQEVTRFLSTHGATINQLNAVRSSISQIKSGGLVRNFGGHSFHTLILSDVLGNPLEVIASGMTVPSRKQLQEAMEVLEQWDPDASRIDASIRAALRKQMGESPGGETQNEKSVAAAGTRPIHNEIIGDNGTAIRAMETIAGQLGCEVRTHIPEASEGDVAEVADQIWKVAEQRIQRGGLIRPFYYLSGGEPTVQLNNPGGKGGRNQHLTLLMVEKIRQADLPPTLEIEFASLGTDGEDGPTNAAGAVVNREVLANAQRLGLDAAQFLASNDSYSYFDRTGGLLKTGPTGTNVCDVRVLSIRDRENSPEDSFTGNSL